MKNVLVTGGGGFLGARIVERLRRDGHVVRQTVRAPAEGDATQIAADFLRDDDPTAWRPRLSGLDIVVNAVGIIREDNEQTFDAIHVRTPIALFQACVDVRVRRVVQISALGADANAISAFHQSKRKADEWLMSSPLSAVMVLPSVVYGNGGASAALFTKLAALPVLILPAGGTQQLQPIHIDDLVDLISRVVEDGALDGRIEAVGPEPISLRDLLLSLRRQMALPDPMIVSIPGAIVRAAIVLRSHLPGARFDASTWDMLMRGNVGSARAITSVLGQRPRTPDRFISRSSAPEMRRQATLSWSLDVLRVAVAMMWIATAAVSAGLYPIEGSLALLERLNLHGTMGRAALFAATVLDLVLGLATLFVRRAWLWDAQIVLVLLYTGAITFWLPEYWLHPFGPVLKNLPILACLWLLRESDRR